MTKKEKFDEIRNRKSNFASKLIEQRKQAQERLKKYRQTLDSGIAPAYEHEPEDTALETEDPKEKETFNEFFGINDKTKTNPIPSSSKKKEIEYEDDEEDYDEDEKINLSSTNQGKPINDFVLAYYTGFKEKGISGKNAALLTIATILGEIGIILRKTLK